MESAKVSQCDAVGIVKKQAPPKIAGLTPIAGFQPSMPDGRWFITYPNVDITFSELGWEGEANDYFRKTGSIEQDVPKGVYANVTFYIDAKTGEIIDKEINNGYILGGPEMFADCE